MSAKQPDSDPLQPALSALALLDDPTRRALYDYVCGHPGTGRDAAAAAVGVSRELTAFHLDRLVKGGLLKASFRRLSGRSGPGAGRPAKIYARAENDIAVSLPTRRYQDAAEVFAEGLEQLATEGDGKVVSGAVEAAAERHGRVAGQQVRGAAGARAGARRRREQLVTFLAGAGYEPSVNAADGSVTLGNCPYRALSTAHRDLTCGMNVAWARGLVAAAGVKDIEPRLAPEPGRCCVVFSPSEERRAATGTRGLS